MFARVIHISLQPESIDTAVTYFQESVGPALKQIDGFKNSRFLVNQDTAKGLMVTLWESEAHREGAETNGFLHGVLRDMATYFSGPPTVDYYEVMVQVQ